MSVLQSGSISVAEVSSDLEVTKATKEGSGTNSSRIDVLVEIKVYKRGTLYSLKDQVPAAELFVDLSEAGQKDYRSQIVRLDKTRRGFSAAMKRWFRKRPSKLQEEGKLAFWTIEPEEPSSLSKKAKTGLGADELAALSSIGHWLEAVDTQHRCGHNLQLYYQVWKQSKTQQSFFPWLEAGKGKNIILEECSREKLQGERMESMPPDERKKYEVKVVDGKLVNQKSQKPIHTEQEQTCIFVIDSNGRWYISQVAESQPHPPGFLSVPAGKAAGRLICKHGTLQRMDTYSVKPEKVEELVGILRDQGVDLQKTKVILWRDLLGLVEGSASRKDHISISCVLKPDAEEAETVKAAASNEPSMTALQQDLKAEAKPDATPNATPVLSRLESANDWYREFGSIPTGLEELLDKEPPHKLQDLRVSMTARVRSAEEWLSEELVISPRKLSDGKRGAVLCMGDAYVRDLLNLRTKENVLSMEFGGLRSLVAATPVEKAGSLEVRSGLTSPKGVLEAEDSEASIGARSLECQVEPGCERSQECQVEPGCETRGPAFRGWRAHGDARLPSLEPTLPAAPPGRDVFVGVVDFGWDPSLLVEVAQQLFEVVLLKPGLQPGDDLEGHFLKQLGENRFYRYKKEQITVARGLQGGLGSNVERGGHGPEMIRIIAARAPNIKLLYWQLPQFADNNTLISAIDHFYGVAGDAPCVVNCSLQDSAGSHDEFTDLATAIDEALSKGERRAFVIAAGNYNDVGHHLRFEGGSRSAEFTISLPVMAERDPVGSRKRYYFVEIYIDNPFFEKIEPVAGAQSAPKLTALLTSTGHRLECDITLGEREEFPLIIGSKDVFVSSMLEIYPNPPAYHIRLRFLKKRELVDEWTLRLESASVLPIVDVWAPWNANSSDRDCKLRSSGGGQDNPMTLENHVTLSSMACSEFSIPATLLLPGDSSDLVSRCSRGPTRTAKGKQLVAVSDDRYDETNGGSSHAAALTTSFVANLFGMCECPVQDAHTLMRQYLGQRGPCDARISIPLGGERFVQSCREISAAFSHSTSCSHYRATTELDSGRVPQVSVGGV